MNQTKTRPSIPLNFISKHLDEYAWKVEKDTSPEAVEVKRAAIYFAELTKTVDARGMIPIGKDGSAIRILMSAWDSLQELQLID